MNYLVALEKEIVSFPGLGWKFHIDNVAFKIGDLNIYWYGILIGMAIALCLILGMRQCRKYGMTPDLLTDYCLLAIPCAFIGARLYYVICEWDTYYVKGNFKATMSAIANVRGGGLAIYGGVIGALFAVILMSKLRKVPIATVLDFAIVYIPLGQAIGRWGNFFNQEAFGTTTKLPWGMTSTEISRYLSINCPALDSKQPVHPTFFYESMATLATFFILLAVRKNSKKPWTTTSCYFILYGVVRFFIEGLRTDSLYITHTELRTSQVVSLGLVVIGLLLISLTRAFGWEKQPIPERFIKADERMIEDARRKREERERAYEEDEDVEDRVERLAKSSFTLEEDEEAEEDKKSSDDAEESESEEEKETSEENESKEENSEEEASEDEEETAESEEKDDSDESDDEDKAE